MHAVSPKHTLESSLAMIVMHITFPVQKATDNTNAVGAMWDTQNNNTHYMQPLKIRSTGLQHLVAVGHCQHKAETMIKGAAQKGSCAVPRAQHKQGTTGEVWNIHSEHNTENPWLSTQ